LRGPASFSDGGVWFGSDAEKYDRRIKPVDGHGITVNSPGTTHGQQKDTQTMNSNVKPIPDGFHSVTPYLTVKGAAQAIDFYKKAFGATERFRMAAPDGKSVGHAEIVIGNSIVMLADEFHGCNQSPQTLNGTSTGLVIYVENADEVFKRAIDAGARTKYPLENKFWGDRAGSVTDPFGHEWTVMTHVEEVPPEEMQKRMKVEFEKMAAGKSA
jgi:PhnB protein